MQRYCSKILYRKQINTVIPKTKRAEDVPLSILYNVTGDFSSDAATITGEYICKAAVIRYPGLFPPCCFILASDSYQLSTLLDLSEIFVKDAA
jgi:hypothetical protein